MREQEKKRKRIYDLLHAGIKQKFLCQPYTKQRKNLPKKSFLRKNRSGGLTKNEKKAL